MKIEVIRTLDGLLGLRREWESLWDDLPRANPYLSWVWQYAWIRSNLGARRLYVLAARNRAGQLAAIAPLQRVPLIVPGSWAVSFIGQEASISSDFLVVRGAENEACHDFLTFIAADSSIVATVLRVAEPLYGAQCLLHVDERGGPRPGYLFEKVGDRSVVDLPPAYEDFVAGLTTKMRQEMRAARRKLGARYAMWFCADTGADDLDRRLEVLFSLNEMRWETGGGRRLYAPLYPGLHDAGILRVFILHANGKPAAALSCLLSGDTMFAELAGFDYTVDSRHLGKAFYGMVFEWAIENGFRYFDFSSGTEDYKRRFQPHQYPKYRIVACSSRSGKLILDLSRAVGRRFHRLHEAAIT